jgi:hypothetical protein
MLRRWSIGMIVVAFLVAAAIPAGAAPAEKVSYIVAECPQAGNPQSVDRFEFPTEDRVLIRGAQNIYDEYVLATGGWGHIGTNETVANGNATWPEFEGPFWGTFVFVDDGTIGSFEGTWSWGNSAYGRAVGKSDDGRLVKITLGLDPAGYPPLPEKDCGVTEFLVINPRG